MQNKYFKKLNLYIELTKPRIMSLVLITTTIGYFLGGRGIESYFKLLFLLIGVGLTCGGASVLNHYLEKDVDALMERTKNRPLPKSTVNPNNALLFGIICILLGVLVLFWKINLLTSFLSLLSAFLYVLVYTPLKRISWLNTSIGAIPGALPPMGGWAAATGDVTLGSWVLFMILFVWQHPHFYAIAWMFKDDYRKGGFKMLPVVYPDGRLMFLSIVLFSVILIPISIIPTVIGLSGNIYLYGSLLCGIGLLSVSLSFSFSKTTSDARRLLKATVIYLPILLILIIADVSF